MYKIALFLFCLMLGAASCKTAHSGASTNMISGNDAQDGSSYARAVVINEKSESKGVDAEYVWLRLHYPGCKVEKQSLVFENKKPYDLLYIITREGEKKTVYFDISNFFGKF
ncbi:MAG: hypothetical protein IT247_09780 [Bacteroidia bacterium]|nr:hypothetical protein [Bacteroidia bacterium]